MTNVLSSRVAALRTALAEASQGKYPVPKIIPVTKTHAPEDILPLAELGFTDIGENRVQEILEKLPALEQHFRVHCIGRLQTNKVKYIADKVCMIQSVDRLELAREIDRRAIQGNRAMPVLVQVSPAGEAQKGGIAPEALPALLQELRHMPGLQVQGLMAIMPHTEDQALLHTLFGNMRTLFERYQNDAPAGIQMQELSMGMSGDYLIAAAHGATMVRVGSAIFGPRDYGNSAVQEK